MKTSCRCTLMMVACFALGLSADARAYAQESARSDDKTTSKQTARRRRRPQPFQWVNPPAAKIRGLTHATFVSPSMNVDVGYCIFLPDEYQADESKRFPVVYYLHGGRPGAENKSVKLAVEFRKHMQAGEVPSMIYVFVNGGPVSHYNMPDRPGAQGEDVFVKELIPHIDATYRTIAARRGRGIEGFSQGGRGTTRMMFKYPELFCSAAPGGAGHATEKRISENQGRESDTLVFAVGDNTYDRARHYAKNPQPPLRILIHVGTSGFNYENNLAYMKFLDGLKIPYEKLIVKDAPHSAGKIYAKSGSAIMQFHARNFGLLN